MANIEVTSPRDRTRELLYQLVRTGEAISRSALVDATGLSRSTVNSAVSKLIDAGRLIETGEEPKGVGSGSGRPATTLSPAPSHAVVGAIDFGHNHITVALGDALGAGFAEERLPMDVDLRAKEAMDAAAESLLALAKRNGIERLDAVAAGVPGPLDSETGLVRSATILSSWVGLAPSAELGRRIGTSVHVENDAVLGSIGELRMGAGRHHRNFMYLRISDGLGAGLILDGEPYRGANGLAGEIGHTPLAGHMDPCRCGRRGCLETVVSVAAVLQRIRHSHPSVPPENISLSEPVDAVTSRILAEAGNSLGDALASFCNLINPSAVILGGELGASGPSLVNGVVDSVRRIAQPATAERVEVLPAELGARAEIVGALQAASQLVT